MSYPVKTLVASLTLPLLLALSSCGDSHDGATPPKKQQHELGPEKRIVARSCPKKLKRNQRRKINTLANQRSISRSYPDQLDKLPLEVPLELFYWTASPHRYPRGIASPCWLTAP